MTKREALRIQELTGQLPTEWAACIEASICRAKSGQYAHGLDAVCRCGRTKGAHTAAAPFTCDAGGMFEPSDGLPECKGFRKA